MLKLRLTYLFTFLHICYLLTTPTRRTRWMSVCKNGKIPAFPKEACKREEIANLRFELKDLLVAARRQSELGLRCLGK